MANIYKIRIFNKDYNIQTEESEEYTKDLAKQLNEKLSEIVTGTSQIAPLDGAVLVALDCLDKSIKCNRTIDQIRGQIKESVDANDKKDIEIAELKSKITALENRVKGVSNVSEKTVSSPAVESSIEEKYNKYTTNFEDKKKEEDVFNPSMNGQSSFFNK